MKKIKRYLLPKRLLMSGKRSRSFKCAIHSRDGEVTSENDFHILYKEPPLFQKMVHLIAEEFLTEGRDRKYYADHYTCCPPPVFILFITILELGFFTYYTISTLVPWVQFLLTVCLFTDQTNGQKYGGSYSTWCYMRDGFISFSIF
uniref:Rhomboid-related protein 3 n=1 Tax=Cacopsylla melanoneura TaxID=428564 RepID=A0A8D9AQB1_9HEMI